MHLPLLLVALLHSELLRPVMGCLVQLHQLHRQVLDSVRQLPHLPLRVCTHPCICRSIWNCRSPPATGAAPWLALPAASTPSFSFSAASAPATGGIFSTGAQPTGTPAFGAALPSTTLIGGGSALPSSPAQTLFGAAPSFSGPLGGGFSASAGAFTPGAGIHPSSLAPTGISTLASPSVNAAPYGNSLAVPPPVISPVSTAKQSHKNLCLGAHLLTQLM